MKKAFLLSCAILLIGCKKTEENNQLNETSTPNEIVETTDSNSNDNDFDAMLADYDDYVEQYIVLFKKAKSGDTDALSEYPALLEKAKELQESIEQAKNSDKLTTEQANKMLEIQEKMMKGMQ